GRQRTPRARSRGETRMKSGYQIPLLRLRRSRPGTTRLPGIFALADGSVATTFLPSHLARPRNAAVLINGLGQHRVKPDRLIIVPDGLIVVPFGQPGVAAEGVVEPIHRVEPDGLVEILDRVVVFAHGQPYVAAAAVAGC